MGRYIIKRILLMVPVLLGVAVLVFTVLYLTPGDAATVILGTSASEADLIAKRHELGIDRPYLEQLLNYLNGLFFHGSMGNSYSTGAPVAKEIMARFPRTLLLAVIIMGLRALMGIPLGVISATHQDKFVDRFCMVLALLGASIPGFWLAIMMILVFSLKLHWLPSFGIKNGVLSYILPCISASISSIGQQARQTRSAVLECIRSDYVSTARAKGLSEKKILYRHILPNAMIPIITVLGTGFGFSLAGTLIIETVFSMPGIGLYMTTGISNRDFPVVTGCVVFVCFCMGIVMLLMDLIYAFLDPRIKAQYSRRGAKN